MHRTETKSGDATLRETQSETINPGYLSNKPTQEPLVIGLTGMRTVPWTPGNECVVNRIRVPDEIKGE